MRKLFQSFIILLFSMNAQYSWATGAAASVGAEVAKTQAVGAVQGQAASAVGEATGIGDKIGELLDSPPGIMIVAGIGGINAMTLYKAAADQEKECDENIKKIDRIIASFKDSFSNFCPNGREKLEEPTCYCYLENGQKNTSRSNSQTCQQLWNKNQYVYDNTAGDYNANGAPVDPAGCLTIDGKFDENCQCKKLINSKGSNACLKTVSLPINNNGLGSAFVQASGVDKVMKNLAQTASGNSNLNSLTGRELGMAIARQGDLASRLWDKIASDPNKKMFPKINSNEQLLAYQKAAISPREMAAYSGGSALAAVDSSAMSPAAAKIVEDVRKKSGIEMTGGNGLGVKKAGNKKEEFSFMDVGAGGGAGGVVSDFPEKNYKYKDADVSKDSGASIFEIISNRYVESGLRRLFETPEEDNNKKAK